MTSQIEIKHLESDADVEASFAVMQQLRPHLDDRDAYMQKILLQRTQGYRLLAALQEGVIVGLAGYRLQDNLIYGHFLYVDDLVVSSALQRSGVGEQLLKSARQQAIALGCAHFILDTGLHNALAQRFYFRQGLLARGMHFGEPLSAAAA
jgi:ribosomal protein S18 acetylase RimI-like enzyme